MKINDEICGLSSKEVQRLKLEGKTNIPSKKQGKSIGSIIADNFLTFFNLINAIIFGILLSLGSYRNCTFFFIPVINSIIGTVQEIRAKKTVEKLTLLSQPLSTALRDGEEKSLGISDIVLGDILVLNNGDQIPADCVVAEGRIEVNEALLTGEADSVPKCKGDELFSASSVVSGRCLAKVVRVGDDNYCETISAKAKVHKKPSSDIINAVRRIIKAVSFVLVPVGIALFCKQYFFLGGDFDESITSSAAGIIGMIPQGLVLLNTLVFATSTIRFAAKSTLVKEMFGIEQLAKVDVICLDKTGTLTDGSMKVEKILPVEAEEKKVLELLSRFVSSLDDNNRTFLALCDFLGKGDNIAINTVPFSSQRKWSAAQFEDHSVILGAYEVLFPENSGETERIVKEYESRGKRVVAAAVSHKSIDPKSLSDDLELFAIIVLQEVIKKEVANTLKFFTDNGIDIKLISGDSADTVSAIASRISLENISAQNVNMFTDEELEKSSENISVFGRVLPEQKQKIISSLQNKGHKVAMVGDGVNDVLALRQADCSVAMSSGSAAAGFASQFLLLNNDLSVLLMIALEGRRAINNVKRTASLYLAKTIYSILLSFCFIFIPLYYPFKPIQLTLISTLFIGIPSFFLALEPNKSRITGGFLKDVLSAALPAGLLVFADVLCAAGLGTAFNLSSGELSTVVLLLTSSVFMILMFSICQPFDKLRAVVCAAMPTIFIAAIAFFGRSIFLLSPISVETAAWIAGGILVNIPMFILLKKLSGKIYEYIIKFVKKIRIKK